MKVSINIHEVDAELRSSMRAPYKKEYTLTEGLLSWIASDSQSLVAFTGDVNIAYNIKGEQMLTREAIF